MSAPARKILVIVVLAALAVALVLGRRMWPPAKMGGSTPKGTLPPRPKEALAVVAPAASVAAPPEPLLGERILEHYGEPSRPAEDDLIWMARALENFQILVKGENPLPLGANEEIANALKGRNRMQLRFLPDRHAALNAKGQLIDRWGTPLYFHAESRDRLEIRSAGPDREMWTADDLHRRSNGEFLRGDSLVPASLYNPTGKSR